jgi:predicted alpha/beta-hydrolase family hydrolase
MIFPVDDFANAPPLLVDGPDIAERTVILAHGAGQGMRSVFMAMFAKALAKAGLRAGGLRVVRFEFPYMILQNRMGKARPPDRQRVLLDSWRRVIARLEADGERRERLVIGGKSLGGRMASLIADEQGVAGLICLGYPFHPPGKPENLRIAHLRTIVTPTLICQGQRDPFGNLSEVKGYSLAPSILMHWLKDGDHSFRARKSSGVSGEENRSRAVEAVIAFIGELAKT